MNLATLTVQIGAQTAGFEQAIQKSAQQLKTFEQQAEKASRPLKQFEQTANGLLVPTSALAKNLDEVGKSAKQAGEQVAKAEKATATAGVSMGKLSGVYTAMGAEMTKLDATTERAVVRLEALAATASRVAIVSAAMTAGLATAGYGFIKAASDATETQNKFEVAFGSMAKDVDAWAVQTADAMGRSRFQMRNFAADTQAMLAPMVGSTEAAAEMSKNISKLAVDLGSFFNVADNDALIALRAGLVGESEPMRRFGVVLTDANVQAWALTQGLKINMEQMDQAGKVALRYAYIMDQTQMAQGDAVRTADSFANQSKALQGDLRNLAEEIGNELLPFAQSLVARAEGLVEWISNLDPATKELAVQFGILAVKGTVAVTALSGAVSITTRLLAILPSLSKAWSLLATNIGLVSKAFTVLSGWPGVVLIGLGLIASVLASISANARQAAVDISKLTDVSEAQKAYDYWTKRQENIRSIYGTPEMGAQGYDYTQRADYQEAVRKAAEAKAKLDELKKQAKDDAKAEEDLKKQLEDLIKSLGKTATTTKTVADVTKDMNAAITAASIKARALGDAALFDEGKLAAMNQALDELTKIGTPEAAKAANELGERIKKLGPIVEQQRSAMKQLSAADILKDMRDELAKAAQMEDALKDKFDLNAEKARIFENALKRLIDAGLKATDPAVQQVLASLQTVTEQMDAATEAADKQKAALASLAEQYAEMAKQVAGFQAQPEQVRSELQDRLRVIKWQAEIYPGYDPGQAMLDAYDEALSKLSNRLPTDPIVQALKQEREALFVAVTKASAGILEPYTGHFRMADQMTPSAEAVAEFMQGVKAFEDAAAALEKQIQNAPIEAEKLAAGGEGGWARFLRNVERTDVNDVALLEFMQAAKALDDAAAAQEEQFKKVPLELEMLAAGGEGGWARFLRDVERTQVDEAALQEFMQGVREFEEAAKQAKQMEELRRAQAKERAEAALEGRALPGVNIEDWLTYLWKQQENLPREGTTAAEALAEADQIAEKAIETVLREMGSAAKQAVADLAQPLQEAARTYAEFQVGLLTPEQYAERTGMLRQMEGYAPAEVDSILQDAAQAAAQGMAEALRQIAEENANELARARQAAELANRAAEALRTGAMVYTPDTWAQQYEQYGVTNYAAMKQLDQAALPQVESTAAILTDYYKQLEFVDKQTAAFGDETAGASAKTALLRSTIENLMRAGLDPMDPVLKDLLNKYRELTTVTSSVTAALKNIGNMVMGKLIGGMPVVNAAIQGAQAGAGGGPAGMAVGALVGVLMESKTFAKLMALANQFLGMFADALGMVLEPLMPIIQLVGMVLAPAFEVLGMILRMVNEPLSRLAFEILRPFGEIILGVTWIFAKLYNWVAGFLNTFGMNLPLMDIAAIEQAMKDLADMTWDEAAARAEEIAAIEKTTEALRNVPEGFKIALTRFTVAEGVIPPPIAQAGPPPISGPYIPPERSRPGSGYGTEPPGNTYIINGDVYGWEDFRRKVAEATSQNGRKATLGRYGLAGAGV